MASRKFLVRSAGMCVLALNGIARAQSGPAPASGPLIRYDDDGEISAAPRA